jgi:serine/threonine protein kinase
MATERFCPDCFQNFEDDMQFCPEHGKPLVVMDDLDEQLAEKVGQVIDGRYRILGILGRGGMGMVFKAEQTSIDREVALKVLSPLFAKDPTAVKRFFREAKMASSLSHPNTVTIHDFARSDTGLLYLAMEYVEGVPLDELIDTDAPLSPERALNIVSYITDSLGEAHQKNLVHRDLKPANVIIQQRFGQADFARVLDFGIAKAMGPGSKFETLTSTGSVCGTPTYMSPEQTLGKTLDGRSDIYALGCILYELLTGDPPYSGDTPMEIMLARLEKDFHVVLQEAMSVHIPENVMKLLLDMAHKNPEDRLTAVDVRNRLSGLGIGGGSSTELAISAKPDTNPVEVMDVNAATMAAQVVDATKPARDSTPVESHDRVEDSRPKAVETSPSSIAPTPPHQRSEHFWKFVAIFLIIGISALFWSQVFDSGDQETATTQTGTDKASPPPATESPGPRIERGAIIEIKAKPTLRVDEGSERRDRRVEDQSWIPEDADGDGTEPITDTVDAADPPQKGKATKTGHRHSLGKKAGKKTETNPRKVIKKTAPSF